MTNREKQKQRGQDVRKPQHAPVALRAADEERSHAGQERHDRDRGGAIRNPERIDQDDAPYRRAYQVGGVQSVHLPGEPGQRQTNKYSRKTNGIDMTTYVSTSKYKPTSDFGPTNGMVKWVRKLTMIETENNKALVTR